MKFSKLKFKDNGKGIKQISKKKQQQPEIESIFQERFKIKDKITVFPEIKGSGLILTSGKGVNGQETKFKSQLEGGDTIIIEHPVSKTIESRNVMLVLGEKSLMLEEPFTQDITTFTPYRVQKKTKVQAGQDVTAEYQKKLQEINKTKPISKPVMNVRVKKGVWSYETKKVEVDEALSKEQLLDIRQKMGKDKFCW